MSALLAAAVCGVSRVAHDSRAGIQKSAGKIVARFDNVNIFKAK